MTGGTGGVHRAGPPARLAQTFEHMGVVLRPHPRCALADIHVESASGDGEGLFEHFFCFGSATKLAERAAVRSTNQFACPCPSAYETKMAG